MTLNNLQNRSGLLGGHVLCEVASLVSQHRGALKAKLASSLTDVWQ